MKLNKVLALALSGVMAVSMLAGCSGNGSNNGGSNSGEEQGNTNAVVEAVMNAQDGNDVVVDFSYSTDLQNSLELAINAAGHDAAEAAVTSKLLTVLDIDGNGWFSNLNGYAKSVDTLDTETAVKVYKVEGNVLESAAVKSAASEINTELKQLIAEQTDSNIVYTYTYSGETAMVTVEKINGDVVYYIAYTVDCATTRALADA